MQQQQQQQQKHPEKPENIWWPFLRLCTWPPASSTSPSARCSLSFGKDTFHTSVFASVAPDRKCLFNHRLVRGRHCRTWPPLKKLQRLTIVFVNVFFSFSFFFCVCFCLVSFLPVSTFRDLRFNRIRDIGVDTFRELKNLNTL